MQSVQNSYQSRRLYAMRALGRSGSLDVPEDDTAGLLSAISILLCAHISHRTVPRDSLPSLSLVVPLVLCVQVMWSKACCELSMSVCIAQVLQGVYSVIMFRSYFSGQTPEWQVIVCASIFACIALGNFITTLVTLLQKRKKKTK